MSEQPRTADASDDALRSLTGVLGAGALCAMLACVPVIGAVRAELHVGPRDVAVALGGFWLVMIAGAIVFHVKGPASRIYKLFDPIESAATQLAVLALVYRSGHGDSFFWVLSIVHMMILGSFGRGVRFNYAMLTAFPLLLAGAFAISGHVADGALCIVIGSLGVYVYWFALSISRKLAAAETELAETRARGTPAHRARHPRRHRRGSRRARLAPARAARASTRDRRRDRRAHRAPWQWLGRAPNDRVGTAHAVAVVERDRRVPAPARRGAVR
jgi:hypothetical protein